jgi:hypothetical protein
MRIWKFTEHIKSPEWDKDSLFWICLSCLPSYLLNLFSEMCSVNRWILASFLFLGFRDDKHLLTLSPADSTSLLRWGWCINYVADSQTQDQDTQSCVDRKCDVLVWCLYMQSLDSQESTVSWHTFLHPMNRENHRLRKNRKKSIMSAAQSELHYVKDLSIIFTHAQILWVIKWKGDVLESLA